MTVRAIALAVLLWNGPVLALDLVLPSGARITVERDTVLDSFEAPVDVFADGRVPVITVEGAVQRTAWRIDSTGLTPLQVMAPLRQQIESAGFETLFECSARACGGFDFRFAVEVLPGPNMYVNIRAYRYLTAIKGAREAPDEIITVLTSTSTTSAYVQVIEIRSVAAAPLPETTAQEPQPEATEPGTLPDATTPDLLAQGHVVLRDLEFRTGASDLSEGPFQSLTELAGLLRAQRELRIALVGHTDSVGALATNIALSKQRAEAVRQRLIAEFGIAPKRMEAEGMGYLSPVASNQTETGRLANRRVEAILLNTR